MSVTFAIAIYVLMWWVVLFAVLPLGVRTQGEDGSVVPGTPESAPTAPRFLRILLLTTLITSVLFGAFWAAVRFDLVDFGYWLAWTGVP
jgi:predicted secreted protein